MTSVWKKLQRVGKNASKFQFTATFESMTVECSKSGKWQPNKLCIIWTRRKRRKCSKLHSWNPGITNPFRGIITWTEPEEMEITVTLYKDPRPGSPYEDKEWTFVIEDESTSGRRKAIAHGTINMVDYTSLGLEQKDVRLNLKLASKKLVCASLDFKISCILIKEGKATDEDMISIGSMLSLNDIGSLNDFEVEPTVATPQPTRRSGHSRNLSHGNSLPRVLSKKEESTESTDTTPKSTPMRPKRTRSKSTTPSGDKYTLPGEQETDERRLSSTSQVSPETDDTPEVIKDISKAEEDLTKWCKTCTKGYKGVKIKNTTTSWRDGLAFCAILHHFHPDLFDFDSLSSENIKENNKLAFDEYEKLGIPRLLDPMTMAISSVPDKLSVMTYLFQIKTHFTQPKHQATPHRKHKTFSLFRKKHSSLMEDPKEKEEDERFRMKLEARLSQNIEDFNFQEIQKEILTDNVEDLKSKPNELKKTDSTRDKDNNVGLKVITADLTEHASSEATAVRKDLDVVAKKRGPRSIDVDDVKRKSGYNPFDDDDSPPSVPEISTPCDSTLKTDISEVKKVESAKSSIPPKEYNPFDEDEPESPSQETNRLAEIISESKPTTGYNPFDEDSDQGPSSPVDKPNTDTETRTKAETTRNDNTSQTRLGYNPFEEDEDEVVEPSKEKPAATGYGYNPFEDDEEENKQEKKNIPEGTSKSAQFQRTRLTASGRRIKLPAPKPRGVPYRPKQEQPIAVPRTTIPSKEPPKQGDSDSPWMPRTSNHDSPTRRRLPRDPKLKSTRPAPRPPSAVAKPSTKPPPIPTLEEWRKTKEAQVKKDSPRKLAQPKRPAPKPPGARLEVKPTENSDILADKVDGEISEVKIEDKEGVKIEELRPDENEATNSEASMCEDLNMDGAKKAETKEDSAEQESENQEGLKAKEEEIKEDSAEQESENQEGLNAKEEEIKDDSAEQESENQEGLKTKEEESSEKIEGNKGNVEQPKEEENTEEDKRDEEDKSAADKSNDIKFLARQVLMDARKKAGASNVLPRERVADITVTQSRQEKTEEGSEENHTTGSAELSSKTNITLDNDVNEEMENKRPSIGKKPAIRPKPSGETVLEKLQAEKDRQEKLNTTARDGLETKKKRDTDTKSEDTKQRQTRTKVNSLISHSQQRDRQKESSNESLNSDAKTTTNKEDQEPKIPDKKTSHVMEHRPLKFKFQKELDRDNENQNTTEKTEKHEFEESEKIKRLRAVLNDGKESKESDGSESETERRRSKYSSSDAESPKPAKRSSRSLEQKGRARLSSYDNDSPQPLKRSSQLTEKVKPEKRKEESSQPPMVQDEDKVEEDRTKDTEVKASSEPTDIPKRKHSKDTEIGSPKKTYISPTAAAQAYAETRKMNFDKFELPVVAQPPPKPPRTMIYDDNEEEKDGDKKINEDSVESVENEQKDTSDDLKDSLNPFEDEFERCLENETSEFQDTTEYVKQELIALSMEQEALDKVAAKLEKELREAMKRKGCEEEEEKLLQEWFILVNKKSGLVRRQAELSLLEKEDDLERRFEMLNRELRALLDKEDLEKTKEERKRENDLLAELVTLVNKRDQLVQIEDTQIQQAERDEQHIQRVMKTVQIPQREKNECVLQ